MILEVQCLNNNSGKRMKKLVGRKLPKNIIKKKKKQGNFQELKDMIFQTKRVYLPSMQHDN